MKLLHARLIHTRQVNHPQSARAQSRRGVALLLALMVLIIIAAVIFQVGFSTSKDAQVARNDIALHGMDYAIESAFLQALEILKSDAEAGAAGGDEMGAGAEAGLGDAGQAPPEGPPGEEGESQSNDSRMDEWGKPQSTTINEMTLRILFQDEDSKYNILNMLNEDEELAQQSFDRVVRILDLCREGTRMDIDSGDAEEMALTMRDHMLQRDQSMIPRARLLTDDEENTNLGMPLTLREFVMLEPFEFHHFRDDFDADGLRVHSIGTFLTIWTAPFTQGGAGAEGPDGGQAPGPDDQQTPSASAISAPGGWAVNVNTAPAAVLHGLVDGRVVSGRVWDEVVLYRNEEEEEEEEDEETEPMLNEFGEETFPTQFFDDLSELEEVYGWRNLDAESKAEVEGLLTVQSNVFSIYITARLETGDVARRETQFTSLREKEDYERRGTSLTRTVRAVFWRQVDGEEVKIVPLLRWEVLDYSPLEVLDFPDDY